MNRKIFLSIIGILILILASLYFFNKPNSKTQNINLASQNQNKTQKSIKINDTEIFVEIAKTIEEKAKGLSERTNLPENQGMIFIFPYKTYPSFWMIDMKIPLDIIWISDNTIIQIDENIQPPESSTKNEELPLYKPSGAINYVLEVNAGFSQKMGIAVGDNVDLTNLK